MKKLCRRHFLIAATVLLPVSIGVAAQPPAKIRRIGLLMSNAPSMFPQYLNAFRRGLTELGHVEGKTIIFEPRFAHGKFEDLPKLAAELVAQKVDVILANTTVAALVAKQTTTTIPIVFAQVNDPVGLGLIASLARPGGNVTGVTTINLELIGKRLEMLKEVMAGKIARVGMLFNPADASNVIALKETERTSKILGMVLHPLPVRSADDLADAFATIRKERFDGLSVAAGSLTNTHAKQITELAAAIKVPAVYAAGEFVDVGGLMAYSANFADGYHRAATYVDKILKGTRPGDIPVEQASTFDLVINMKAASGLGVKFPDTILVRTPRIIQ